MKGGAARGQHSSASAPWAVTWRSTSPRPATGPGARPATGGARRDRGPGTAARDGIADAVAGADLVDHHAPRHPAGGGGRAPSGRPARPPAGRKAAGGDRRTISRPRPAPWRRRWPSAASPCWTRPWREPAPGTPDARLSIMVGDPAEASPGPGRCWRRSAGRSSTSATASAGQAVSSARPGHLRHRPHGHRRALALGRSIGLDSGELAGGADGRLGRFLDARRIGAAP